MRVASSQEQGQIRKPREQVDDPQAADRTAHEVVREKDSKPRKGQREIVVFPECGPPRHHEEQQADLDEENDVEKPAEQRQLPAWTLVRRSIRASTSRYDPASD